MNYSDEWADAKEVSAPPPEVKKKKCEAVDCLEYFEVTWPSMRRCERCRREKREYKDPSSPF